jgi:hypothetical protein
MHHPVRPVLLVAAFTLAAMPALVAQRGQTPTNPTVAVTIADDGLGGTLVGGAYNIRSDGGGVYAHGNGIEAQLWVSSTTSTGDMTLKISSKSPRAFSVEAPSLANPGVLTTATDGWWINIRNVGRMTDGSTKETTAEFTTAAASYRWCGGGCAGTTSPVSQKVRVTRSGNTWSVTSVPELFPPNPDPAPNDGLTAVRLLSGKGGFVPRDTVELSFALTFTCVATCP